MTLWIPNRPVAAAVLAPAPSLTVTAVDDCEWSRVFRPRPPTIMPATPAPLANTNVSLLSPPKRFSNDSKVTVP